ncbi:MAG: hypothetical protein L3K06_04345 [Thermoplasmata archaeon]|nr:hypothetical protein [Thermoplasmata archaeon]
MDPVGLARVALAFVAGAVAGATVSTRALGADAVALSVWADRDDDDTDGHPDGEQAVLSPANFVDLVEIDKRLSGAVIESVSGGDRARMVGAKGPVPWGRAAPHPGWFQGVSPGRVELVAKARGGRVAVTIDVQGVDLRDGEGRTVDLARSHGSLARTAPARVEESPGAPFDDPDALRLVVSAPEGGASFDSARSVGAESLSPLGVRLDAIPRLALTPVACPGATPGLRCWASPPLRFVVDDVDRDHPLGLGRSIKAEVGGAVIFRSDGRKAQMIRVLGPRSSPVGPIGRLRASVRPFVMRVTPGGVPAVGGSDVGAVAAVRSELAAASAIWGQCGLTFGDPRSLDVRVVDPPPAHLVSLGDGLGLPAAGGQIRMRADGKTIAVTTTPREPPGVTAFDIARAAEHAGLTAVVSPNARTGPALWPSVDVSLRRRDGTLVAIETVPGAALSTDRMLSVHIGSVDLTDGIAHFTDMDAVAGTLEERTLIKAIDDGDPTTVEVVVVPLFAGGGRIGESFIGSDLSSVRNVVLLDRAGIRARQSSLTLAHELGHVLLDLPGHPDDYGLDTPTSLMDSDAADPSPFGPRRISVDESARVVRQSGPSSRAPLLTDWPIGPIPSGGVASSANIR